MTSCRDSTMRGSDAAVEDEGDRTVVDKLHLHVRAEDAGLDREIRGLAQGLDELIEQALRRRRIGRLIEPGTPPFAGVTQQRELRDCQESAPSSASDRFILPASSLKI